VPSWRLSPAAFSRLTLFGLVALVFVIVTGGAVRLTGSGLGCPSWPTCVGGHLVPPDHFYSMVEWLNRVVTGLVSVAVMLLAVGAFLRSPRRRDLTWLSMGLVVGLVGQIVLGGETVRHRLNPAFVMSHFLLSMAIVFVAVVLHHRASVFVPPVSLTPSLRPLAGLIVVAAAVTVVMGTIVTGAGPHSGANSSDGRVARWHLDLHRVTQVHGTSAVVLVALSLTTLWLLHTQHAPPFVVTQARQLVEVLGIQVGIGYTQYLTGVPVGLVMIHILGAALVWVFALRLALTLTSAPAAVRELVPA
jgi:cytochrome c oxidase assembly protein subunit 15